MKKSFLLLGASALLALTGCGKNNADYVVGVAQFAPHVALDAATKGFKDKLSSLLEKEGKTVEFKDTNAAGEISNCPTIINDLVSKRVDLIMANATPCVSAAYNATSTIPVLGTSVTDYGVALGLSLQDGKTGINVSGTSDLAPLDEQVNIMTSLVPSATNFGILYSSSEANSKFQVEEVKKHLQAKGLTATEYAISGAESLNSICNAAKANEDCIYIPTDNFCADNANTIAQILENSKPIFAGEAGICQKCGFATLSIDYYRLGEVTGEMAFEVLFKKANPAELAIRYDNAPKKQYVKSRCEALGITVTSDFEELKAE
jgi:putative ABC transport system substrate-binding protein